MDLPDLSVRQLAIVDRQGRARIVIGLASDGEPTMRFLDREGREFARFGLAPAGPTGQIEGNGLRAELQLGALDKGSMLIAQAGTTGEGFVELASSPANEAGSVLMEVDQSPDHRASISVLDHRTALQIEVMAGICSILTGGTGGDLAQPGS